MRVEQLTLFDVDSMVAYRPVAKSVCLSVGDFAKVLSAEGYDCGRVKLFEKLRQWKMLNKDNVPYQEFVDRGYFMIIKEYYKRRSNASYVFLKVLVTPIGQKFIEERYKNERDDNRS